MKRSRSKRIFITFSLILLSVLMILAGIFRGEAELVLNKAVRICMECIGIG